MVTGFKFFDQKLNKNHWKWTIFAQLYLLKYIYLCLIIIVLSSIASDEVYSKLAKHIQFSVKSQLCFKGGWGIKE